jgi:preprotein translocase subunit SecG
MYTFIVVVHVLACFFLVVTVLLQQGKGAEVGAVFGSSEAIFGATGPATLLSKITTGCAVLFMITSLTLTYMSINKKGESVMHRVVTEQPAPSQPPAGQQVPAAAPAEAAHDQTSETPAPAPQGGEAK